MLKLILFLLGQLRNRSQPKSTEAEVNVAIQQKITVVVIEVNGER